MSVRMRHNKRLEIGGIGLADGAACFIKTFQDKVADSSRIAVVLAHGWISCRVVVVGAFLWLIFNFNLKGKTSLIPLL